MLSNFRIPNSVKRDFLFYLQKTENAPKAIILTCFDFT